MAGIVGSINTGATEIALAAATAKTVLQIVAPANQRLKIREVTLTFDGISASAEPGIVEIVKQTDAGTVTSVTPKKAGEGRGGGETLQATAGKNATAEPTTTDVLDVFHVHPQTGFKQAYGPGDEIPVPGGERVGIRVTMPAIVNCLAAIKYEE